MESSMRKPELLIPASSLEVLKTAVLFGADAVYLGGEAFGLRAKAKNFSPQEMRQGIAFAHDHGVKVHVTANILAHNRDLAGAEEYFKELKELKPDALIIADPGMFMLARRICPEIDIHVSTQANNTNYMTWQFWHDQGAKLCQRAFTGGDQADQRKNPPGYGNRELHPRFYVHLLFGEVSAQQLFYGKGCQSGLLHPSLPLEVCGGGGEPSGGISPRL